MFEISYLYLSLMKRWVFSQSNFNSKRISENSGIQNRNLLNIYCRNEGNRIHVCQTITLIIQLQKCNCTNPGFIFVDRSEWIIRISTVKHSETFRNIQCTFTNHRPRVHSISQLSFAYFELKNSNNSINQTRGSSTITIITITPKSQL